METRAFFRVCFIQLSSYRTYEEWKPSIAFLSSACVLGSYRTYEEWKHPTQR